ncbi:alginate O-acetyltransferase [Bacteroidia bacterium]|nr:alginate O-acetyltransferase [Bacteroidia bacterium]
MSFWETIQSALLYNENSVLLFTHFSFWIFFAMLLVGYTFVYNKNSLLKSAYLLIFSIFFYYKASGFYFLLLIFITLVNYYIAHAIHKTNSRTHQKTLVGISVAINLGWLAYFKYTYFFAQIIEQIFGIQIEVVNVFAVAIDYFTNGGSIDVTQIILPVGISFYIFQVISHTIDVYRHKIEPVRNIVDFGFYISFFPSLIAGPIIRASDFVPQIYQKYVLSAKELWMAIFLIINGLVKKIVVSNYISLNFVDRIFDDPTLYSGFELLMGSYGYTLQIYCDFSGYTDIAIGMALLLGFRLPANFNSPYKAHSISDFWHRWHISLSTWLRDYLYISMGGNRKGKIRTYINLFITMLLGGLWHGASYKFIIWGGLHGIILVIEKWWKQQVAGRLAWLRVPRVVGVLVTFHVVAFTWIFFRAADLDTALMFISRIFTQFHIAIVPDVIAGYSIVFGVMLAAYILHFLPTRYKQGYKKCFVALPIAVKLGIIVLLIFCMYQISSAALQPFIYFQF